MDVANYPMCSAPFPSAPAGRSLIRSFACIHGCGATGTAEEIAQHELTSARLRGGRAPHHRSRGSVPFHSATAGRSLIRSFACISDEREVRGCLGPVVAQVPENSRASATNGPTDMSMALADGREHALNIGGVRRDPRAKSSGASLGLDPQGRSL